MTGTFTGSRTSSGSLCGSARTSGIAPLIVKTKPKRRSVKHCGIIIKEKDTGLWVDKKGGKQ